MKKMINITKIKTNIALLVTSMFLVVGCGGEGSKDEVSLNSLLVTVPDNISPVARVNKTSVTVTQGDKLNLDASSSTDEDGNIVSYLWQLADGTNIGEGEQFSYNTSSLKVGKYKVRLIVTDDDGATGVVEVTVKVNEKPAPAPAPEPSPEPNPEPSPDNTMPVITLNGASSMTLQCGEIYTEQNATAIDAEDGVVPVTTLGMVDTTTAGSYTVTYRATDSDGNTVTKSRTIMVTGIVHNGTSYCTVTSPYTGRVWIDRNLGAARVCTSLDDTACYGDYYQWGRNFDGHQDSGSATTTTQATDVNNVGSEFIITPNYTYDRDWAKTADADGSKRSANWSKTDGSSVCPIGYRVPTKTELKVELLDAGSAEIQNNTDAFNSFLMLPSAGYHLNSDGSMSLVGSWGDVWSSSVDLISNGASDLLFRSTDAGQISIGYRANGLSVRCIKN